MLSKAQMEITVSEAIEVETKNVWRETGTLGLCSVTSASCYESEFTTCPESLRLSTQPTWVCSQKGQSSRLHQASGHQEVLSKTEMRWGVRSWEGMN